MINKLFFKLSGRLPCRLIELDNGPYLERYYVGKYLGVTFYLHRFVSADSERHIHNHPWGWGASLILAGKYVEERCLDICPTVEGSGCITDMIHRHWFNRVDGNTFHRIHDAEPGTWTLFLHGPRIEGKGWGFFERQNEVTVFRSHTSAPTRWWEEAPKGRNSGRVPL